MKVVVIGSGIVGTASAWFLNKAGHDVTVVERQGGSAMETTYANGAQISVSHSEPWSNPAAPMKLLKWLGKEDAPLLYRFRPEWLQWEWGMRFLLECMPSRTSYNIRQCMRLAEYSLKTTQEVRAETNIEYHCLTRGIMHFFTDQKDFEDSSVGAKLMTSLGCLRKIISADEVIKIEPALARVRSKIVGGDFTPSDESGDARVFTSELAKRCAEKGVEFRYHTDAQRLLPVGAGSQARIGGLEVIRPDGLFETIKADAYVISMGSFSAPFLKPLGISLMIYPVKGYSATFPVIKPDAAPYVSLIDVGAKLVYSRLGDRLRVGGTAEMNGYSRVLNEVRCNMLRDRAREIFPDSCNWDEPNFWTGLRPTTPSNRPYVGRTQFKNLFLNSGHGTLGWTMGCGSGRAIAEIVSGRRPEVDFNFCGMMN